MSGLRCLVVEDAPNWRNAIRETLGQIGNNAVVEVAGTYAEAVAKLYAGPWDLVTVDLSLDRTTGGPARIDQTGMVLMSQIRQHDVSARCGIVVLTGFPSTKSVKTSLKQYGVDDFVEKKKINEAGFWRTFLQIARAAVRNARVREAEWRAANTYAFTLTVSGQGLVRSELRGPTAHTVYMPPRARRLPSAELARKMGELNALVLRGGDAWRPHARSIGDALFRALSKDSRVVGDLGAAQRLARPAADLRLKLEAPADGLRLPFELLRIGGEYIAFKHVLSRRLTNTGSATSSKPEPFHAFVKDLVREKQILRVLVIGANADGRIKAAETEAKAVADQIKADAGELGIACKPEVLIGKRAGHASVTQELDKQWHVIHYAGHGHFDDRVTEASGLVLKNGRGVRTLIATDLKLYLADTPTRLVFLSCCFGGETGEQIARNDVAGVLDALGQADVPNVLTYRWTVDDVRAKALALNFYSALFKTLSPGEALLSARCAAARGLGGMDDDTWAAPLLLEQAS